MLYESKIKYLEYRLRGERICGCGFVRLEGKGDQCNIRVNISNVPVRMKEQDTGFMPAKLFLGDDNREVEFATLDLAGGSAQIEFLCMQAPNLKGSGISYEKLSVLRVTLPEGGEIYGKLKDKAVRFQSERLSGGRIQTQNHNRIDVLQPLDAQENRWNVTGEDGSFREAGYCPEEEHCLEDERIPEYEHVPKENYILQDKRRQADQLPGKEADSGKIQAREADKGELRVAEKAQLARREKTKPTTVLEDNKWKQLSSIYPHLNPFQDEREYLSLKPEDFVILSEKDYGLIHNSFLLHGYYNYKHLILQRLERRGEVKYYLGVPGNFYDREKQVAVMFGFENFECLEEPAESGDYGYYMMPVEL